MLNLIICISISFLSSKIPSVTFIRATLPSQDNIRDTLSQDKTKITPSLNVLWISSLRVKSVGPDVTTKRARFIITCGRLIQNQVL